MPRSLSSSLAVLVLTMSVAVGALLPATPDAWTPVSAQTLPRLATGDRMFLKIDGVTGEVADDTHSGELALQSFSFGLTRTIDSSARAQFKDVRFAMAMDASSPMLLQKTAGRQRIAKVTMTLQNSLGQDYARWTFSDVLLTSFNAEESVGMSKPKVWFDMNFGKIDVEYRSQLNNGALGPAVKGGWDVRS